MRDGMVVPKRSLEIVVDSDVLTVADGQRGMGQWLCKKGVAIGIEKCRKHGVSLVAMRNCGHMGRIGAWAEIAAEEGG